MHDQQNIEENTGNKNESVYDVVQIPLRLVADIWGYAYPYIMLGRHANPELTFDDIVEGIIDQSVQLWIVVENRDGKKLKAVFLTSVERDKEDWVLSLFNLGGEDPKSWVSACHQAMHEFAKKEGCARVRLCGRPGWQRILPDYPITGRRGDHYIYERPVIQ